MTSTLDGLDRELGRVTGSAPGPTVIAVAGLHGNEPAGLHAARAVLQRASELSLRGELVAFAGNLGALRARVRHLSRDMNRGWTDHHRDAGAPEDIEQRELHAALETALVRARGEVYVVDLHSTSASGFPFALFVDSPRQRRFAAELQVPLLLKLEERIEGTLAAYWRARGCVAVSFEGGQHDDPLTVRHMEDALWISMAAAGILTRDDAPEINLAYERLDEARGGLPRWIDVLSRHHIAPDDGFVMEPGFDNIHRVGAGQRLARDLRGEITAPHDGIVMMPLYQSQGSDGFFWGRELP